MSNTLDLLPLIAISFLHGDGFQCSGVSHVLQKAPSTCQALRWLPFAREWVAPYRARTGGSLWRERLVHYRPRDDNIVGKHIGQFAGIPATGKDVCVVYDLEDALITRGRIYFEMPALLAQLGVIM